MSAARICLIIAGFLFALAAILAFGIVKGGPPIEGLALLGFGFWAVSGAA